MGYIKSGLFISLDGVIESPETWHFQYFNDEMGAVVGELMAATTPCCSAGRPTTSSRPTGRPPTRPTRSPAR